MNTTRKVHTIQNYEEMFRMNLITSEKLVRNLWARKELNLSQNPPQVGRQNNRFSGRLMAEEREIYTSLMRARRLQGKLTLLKIRRSRTA